MEQQQPAKLSDVLNYEPERYITDAEISLIKTLTPDHLKVIRKIMLPTISDPDLPVEEMGKDAYLTGVDWLQMSAEHAKTIMQGRQEAIKFVIGGLIQLKMYMNLKPENPYAEQLAKKNSTK